MATPREIRQLAFQALFHLDLTGCGDLDSARQAIEESGRWSDAELDKAASFALAAFEAREAADRRMEELAPKWPAHRQAAVDRAILRLAFYEMTNGQTPAKVAVNEAVELAKRYSTERSPSFINALLDKVLKDIQAQSAPAHVSGDEPATDHQE